MVRPSQRREMVQQTVTTAGISIRLACTIYQISQTGYRYEAKATSRASGLALPSSAKSSALRAKA